jgi:cathepsin F
MKFAAAAIFATLATAAVAHKHPHKKLRKRDAVRSHRKQFKDFMNEHGKVYQTQDEHEHRFSIFSKNLLEFDELNADLVANGKDAIHGATQFTDMERSEFEEQYLGAYYTAADFPNLETITHFPEGRLDSTRGKYQLSDDGLMTDVKDQMQCGSCWAFAATETLETAWAKAGNDLVELSPQQIVSCDVGNGDYGCSGGMPSSAFEYVFTAGGIASEADYPYTSGSGDTGTCTSPLPAFSATASSDAAWAYAQDACMPGSAECVEDSDAIASAIKSYGGIAIAIDASAFFSYTGGVMTADSCSSNPSSLDHAIQIVGYNADENYWIVRNSWNTSWGEDGLVRMEMGTNTCGLANIAALITSL